MGGGELMQSARILMTVDGKPYDDTTIRAVDEAGLRKAMREFLDDFGNMTKVADGEFTVKVADTVFWRKERRIGKVFNIKVYKYLQTATRPATKSWEAE